MRDITARQIMTRNVVGVLPNDTVRTALERLLQHGISGMPVVSEAGRLVGIISEEDIIGILYEQGRFREVLGQTLESSRAFGAPLVTMEPAFVSPDTPRKEIARRLMMRRIKRMPVVDDDGRVVGVVSRQDILRSVQAELWPVGDEE